MSILETINKARIEFRKTEGCEPLHCYLTLDEGFDLLKHLLPTMKLTHMERVELNMVLREKHVAGLKEAFKGSTIYGVTIHVTERAG